MTAILRSRRAFGREAIYFAPTGRLPKPRPRTGAPVVQDIFSGAGLFSSAFAAEGFRLVHAVEMNPTAAQTYAQQLGDHITIADVRNVSPTGRADVLIAGPPCQGFSTLGRRAANDPRNLLSFEVVRWAKALRPKVVVIENVAAFVGSKQHQQVVAKFEAMGYEVTVEIVDAADFGVPQHRLRSFTFASRVGTPVLRKRRGPLVTVRDAWDGLPESPDGVNLHIAPAPSPIALERFRLIPPGGDRRDILRKRPDLAPASWKRLGVHVTDAWGRMLWDEPSNTLRTMLQNPSKGRYIHPSQHRVISVREAARLHSIPDTWSFVGYREEVTTQLGNSVPPKLGRAVARAVLELL